MIILNGESENAEQQRMQRSLSPLNDLFGDFTIGILILDSNFKILWANETIREFFDFWDTEIRWQDERKLIKKEIKNIFENPDLFEEKILALHDENAHTENFECHILPEGERKERWIEHWSSPIKSGRYKGGRIEYYFDISERKQLKEKFLKSKKKIKQSFIEFAVTTSKFLGLHDPYTEQHVKRVANLSREVARRMGFDEERLLGLYLGGLLHDIGKIAIPKTVLIKPGKIITEIEWDLIRSHPKVGYEKILGDISFPWPVAEMTLHHHERLDGSGYPEGLKGGELSLEVRILGAVDVIEAMSSRRPYRPPRSKKEGSKEIREGKGEKYDWRVVDILLEMIESGEIKFGEVNEFASK